MHRWSSFYWHYKVWLCYLMWGLQPLTNGIVMPFFGSIWPQNPWPVTQPRLSMKSWKPPWLTTLAMLWQQCALWGVMSATWLYKLLGVKAYPWILSKYVCVCLFVCPPTNYIGVCILVVKLQHKTAQKLYAILFESWILCYPSVFDYVHCWLFFSCTEVLCM